MDSLVEYLFARVDALKRELAALELARGEDVARRVMDASSDVARASLRPATDDLRIRADGRKILAKVSKDKADEVGELLALNRSLLHMRDSSKYGFTLLHAAAEANSPACVRLLCGEFEVDPLVRDLLGRTALHVAAEKLCVDACEALLEFTPRATGENAPLDAAGVTPAGKTAVSKKNLPAKSALLRMLHKVGDASISPMKAKREDRGNFYGHAALPGYRVNMEDYVACGKVGDMHVFGVFDGHGGSLAARVCSEELLRAVGECASLNSSLEEHMSAVTWSLESLLSEMDEFVIRTSSSVVTLGDEAAPSAPSNYCLDASGTTLNMVFLTNDSIGACNVGDSRCILIRKSYAEEILLSRDHKPYGNPPPASFYEDERTRVYAAGGTIDDSDYVVASGSLKLGMTRSLGNFEAKANPMLSPRQQIIVASPDTIVVPRVVAEDEFIVSASDGLWDVMECREVVTFVRDAVVRDPSLDARSIAKMLALEALQVRESRDNISVIVVDLRVLGVPRQEDILERTVDLGGDLGDEDFEAVTPVRAPQWSI